MLKRVYILILKSFLWPFISTFAVAVFILLMIPLIKYADDIFGKGLDYWVMARLIFYFCIQTTAGAIPLAILLANLMTFGNLGEKNELTALKSVGVSFQKLLIPVFIISIFLTWVTFQVNNKIIPYCNLKLYSLLYDVKQMKPAMEIKSGVFYNAIDGYSIRVIKKKPSDDKIKQIMIYNHSDFRGNNDVILADSGVMYKLPEYQYLKVVLFNGVVYSELPKKGGRSSMEKPNEFVRTWFEKCELMFDLSSFNLQRTKEELFAGNKSMLNVAQLSDTLGKMSANLLNQRNNYPGQIKVYYRFLPGDTSTHLPKTDSNFSYKGSLFGLFSPDEQRQIIKNALAQVRSAQSFTSVYGKIISQQEKDFRKIGIEYHFKYTMSVACILMFLIGAPLGAIVKKGGFGVPVIISMFFYILYYVLSIMGKKWAQEAIYTVPSGMWFGSILLLPIGLYFLYVAMNDRPLVNWTFLKKLFKG